SPTPPEASAGTAPPGSDRAEVALLGAWTGLVDPLLHAEARTGDRRTERLGHRGDVALRVPLDLRVGDRQGEPDLLAGVHRPVLRRHHHRGGHVDAPDPPAAGERG